MYQTLDHFAAHLRGCIASSPAGEDVPFDRLARELCGLQFDANLPFRRLCEARGATPDRVADWRGIPAVPTRAFKEYEVTCLPAWERSRVFHSSGTTAQAPSRHFHHQASLELYETSLRCWFRPHLLPDGFGGRMLSLTPPVGEAPHSSLVHMLDTLVREQATTEPTFLGQIGCDGAWLLDAGRVVAELEGAVAEGKPCLLAGTAFSFVHLLDDLALTARRFELPPASRLMETGGYKGRSRALPKAVLHQRLTESLGVPPGFIVTEYGMSELSSQAYDHVVGSEPGAPAGARVFHFPPWARAVVVSAETGREVADGETGLLRIFDLANAYSVLAVQTEDLAVRRGAGFELVGRAEQAGPRGCSLLPAA
jgi:hypothetical protein